jgi:two-component system LytT family sensor kinase
MKAQGITSRQRPIVWIVIFGGWTFYGLYFASQAILQQAYQGRPITWRYNLAIWLICGYVWAALTPIILYLSRRFPIERRNWPRKIIRHLFFSAVTSLVLIGVYVFVTNSIALHGARKPFGLAFRSLFIIEFHVSLLTYWAIVGIDHAFAYYRKYRERELVATQLEARLAQAELQVLKMQLHPHFLFNTLNAISALMHRDVEAADKMVARLSDLLRSTLENVGVQEVSLKQELEMLERYLEIEQTRFQDRLTVQMRIEPETLDARVPNLILQPLVENAIQHGIAPRSSAGRIEIRAARENGTLKLDIEDNGRGMPEGFVPNFKKGVGLANTRARLEQLYGAAHSFKLLNSTRGGLIVSLSIPFSEMASETNGKDTGAHRR